MIFKIRHAKVVLSVLFVSMFVVSNLITPMSVSGILFQGSFVSEDRNTVVDYSEENLDGSMFWGSFLTDCQDPEKKYNAFGYFDNITFHMEMNFDKGSISGFISGSHDSDTYSFKKSFSCSGEFSGTIEKYNWNYDSWFWEFGSNFSMSLTFRYEQRCTSEQNEVYWNTRQETISVIANLGGDTFAGRGGIGGFSVVWEEPGTGPENRRYIRIYCRDRLSSGGCDLPADIPEPIDIVAKIEGPNIIRNSDPSVNYDLVVSGRDSDRVTEVNWYFSYFDKYEDGWENFWWFETFKKTDTSSLVLDRDKLEEWEIYVNEYGVQNNGEKALRLEIIVELKAGENEWLYEVEGYNITYYVGHSIDFNLIVEDTVYLYPTMKNVTELKLSHSGTDLSDKVTFEVANDLPEYLQVDFLSTSTEKSPNGIIDNKIMFTLDLNKAPSLTLPEEQEITVIAKSKVGVDPIETSENIRLVINPVKWLIMHYSASNTVNSLQKYEQDNIMEIVTALNNKETPKVGYVLLIDLQKSWKPPSYSESTSLAGGKSHLLKYFDDKLELLETSEDLDMSSPDTLTNFMDDAKKTMPAENTILIISDHGEGVKGIITEANNKIMKINELVDSLDHHKLNLLVLEACRMAKLPVLYELRNTAEYILSCQTGMAGTGFQYTTALTPLLSNPSKNSVEIGKLLIDSYRERYVDGISLVDTSKIESVVQALNKLEKTIEKGIYEKGEEYGSKIKQANTRYSTLMSDVRAFAENILRHKGITDTQTRTDAETLREAVESAVIHYKMRVNENLIVYSGSERGLVLLKDLPPEESEDVDFRPILQLFGIGFEAVKNEELEYFEKYTWPDLEKTQRNAGVVIRKDQKGNNLYIRVVDGAGNVNGYDPESEYKSKIELNYAQAEYIDFLNGTQIIFLPQGVEEFSTIIYGGSMEDPDETYSISYSLFEGNEIVAGETIENPIHENTEHTISITVYDGQIEIGEMEIKELEVEQEPIEPQPDEPESQSKGIPGFPSESIILGIIIALVIFLWKDRK